MKITRSFTDRLALLDFCRQLADSWDFSRPLCLKIDELRRHEIQSRKFHALCNDIAKAVPWAGARRNPGQWKHLLVSGHTIATRENVEIVAGLEGELLNIRENTARMNVSRMASLIEYTLAWGVAHGVKFREVDYSSYPESQ